MNRDISVFRRVPMGDERRLQLRVEPCIYLNQLDQTNLPWRELCLINGCADPCAGF